MKKTYKVMAILIAVFAFSTLVNAQTWDAPMYKGEAPVSGTTYFIYNVGADAFLNRGGEWATEAVVTAFPRQNASTNINRWSCVESSGVWTFQYNNNGSNVSNHFLFQIPDGAGWIYTDNSTNNIWEISITDAPNNIYAIQVASSLGHYNSSVYLGAQEAARTSNYGICNSVRYNEAPSDYTKWKFVSQANYDLFVAKKLLHRYMNYAKAVGVIDLTTYIATYNSDVTADITTAAANLLTALGRTPVTIPNYSFETDYNSSTDWTNVGFGRHSSSPTQGWTKDGTWFGEKWISSGSNLPASTLSQTITGLADGIYGLVASAHAVKQQGSNPLKTGAFLKAGGASAEVSAGGEYYADYAIAVGGVLSIGYALEGTIACNWTGYDNFRLYYYGPTAVPSMLVSKSSIYFTDYISNTTTFTVTGANLAGDINLSAPAGIMLSGAYVTDNGGGSYTIANANANSENTVTVLWDEDSNLSGTIAVSSTGVSTHNISISTSKDKDCYTPLYSDRTNIVADPIISSLSTFGGWGALAIVTDPALVYCGASSAMVGNGTGNNSGSLDVGLVGKIEPEKTYRVKAMVKTTDGTFQLGVFGWSSGQGDLNNVIDTNGNWQELIFNFTTGATLDGNHGMFWNNWGLTGTLAYIDNWEMYDVTDIVSGTKTVNDETFKVYINNQQIVAEVNTVINGNAEIAVYNVQGARLHAENAACYSGFNRLAIEKQLPSGVYLVQITVGGEIFTAKLVK